MHLFVIYIGGTHESALIELHDLRLIVAEAIEDIMILCARVGGERLNHYI